MFRLLAVSSVLLSSAFGCTNILVSKSAATAGTGTIIAYNADSGTVVFHMPRLVLFQIGTRSLP
jgi:hypothetical protein